MDLKIIQVNVYMGKYLENLVSFLKNENPDILLMQEVSSFKLSQCFQDINIFEFLKENLGMFGVFSPLFHHPQDARSYFGNAILVKGDILSSDVIWLKGDGDIALLPDGDEIAPLLHRNIVSLEVKFGAQVINVNCTHGEWAKQPFDTPEKIRQGKIVKAYIKRIKKPFILAGDFNIVANTQVIRGIEEVANNIVKKAGITNSLHPSLHRLEKSLLIDFIFVSRQFRVLSVDAPMVDVSDHLPIRAVVSI